MQQHATSELWRFREFLISLILTFVIEKIPFSRCYSVAKCENCNHLYSAKIVTNVKIKTDMKVLHVVVIDASIAVGRGAVQSSSSSSVSSSLASSF
ncbi:hypothetical protein T05_5380 [Trichinella murrelli]|uniref:Uncharacterized protein n=1 Tax=Trichinella murrelli TaxID=144512 RepID=A0A0V0TQK7_9BILA|nr:hypothetical protein T05_5380 [Trichinella murrelli]